MKNRIMKGFTIIELLLVISIIAILSTISFSSFNASISKSRDTTRKSDLSQIRKALETFNNQFGEYPDSDGNHKILGCLDTVPADPKDPNFIACPSSNGGFRYYVNGEEENSLIKYPIDPVVNRSYYYEKPDRLSSNTDSFAIYAALENTQDKDVKLLNGQPDPDGWGMDCGSVRCNYKITNVGLQQ